MDRRHYSCSRMSMNTRLKDHTDEMTLASHLPCLYGHLQCLPPSLVGLSRSILAQGVSHTLRFDADPGCQQSRNSSTA